jgi:hypothetical protein
VELEKAQLVWECLASKVLLDIKIYNFYKKIKIKVIFLDTHCVSISLDPKKILNKKNRGQTFQKAKCKNTL